MLVLILLDVVGEAVVFVLALTRGHCTPQGPCVETSTGGAESTGRFITQARREIKKKRREEEGVVSLRVEEIRMLESRGLVKVERGLGQFGGKGKVRSGLCCVPCQEGWPTAQIGVAPGGKASHVLCAGVFLGSSGHQKNRSPQRHSSSY